IKDISSIIIGTHITLSQLKLIKHCKLIEHSASEIWASEKCLAEIISKIFSLAIVRTPNKYSKLSIILGVLNINSKYRELEKILAEKDFM
ncbi:4638_t:CDS:2, partial [Racocetra persica]